MRTRAVWLVRLALVAVALGCGDGGGSPAVERVAPEAVLTGERTLVDTTRATPPKAGFDGAPERTVAVRLWWAPEAPRSPACAGDRCALVVLAHGFGGSTARFDALARRLAGAGYVVAAPRFPLTNEAAPGGHLTGLADLVAQPGDVSFVIDELVAASERVEDALAGRVDGERIGVVGHSLGGATVLALTRLACCTDPRVDAVVGVAAADFALGLFGEPPAPSGPPTLSIVGGADRVVPAEGVRAFHDAILPPRAYLAIPGANHVDLVENVGAPSPNLEPTARATEAFFDAWLGGDAGALGAALEELAAEGNAVSADL